MAGDFYVFLQGFSVHEHTAERAGTPRLSLCAKTCQVATNTRSAAHADMKTKFNRDKLLLPTDSSGFHGVCGQELRVAFLDGRERDPFCIVAG